MATQITHIAVAQNLFDRYFSQHSKRDFFIGTVFPDIRYLGGVSRDATHYYDLTFVDLTNESNAFLAGLKLHCLLDQVREAFVVREGVYSLFTTTEKKYSVPKLLEDELFYGTVMTWPEIIDYFDTILTEETAYGVSSDHIVKWHRNLQRYFAQPPTDVSRQNHALDLGMPLDRIHELNRALGELRQSRRAREIAHAFYNNLESLLNAWTTHDVVRSIT